MVRQAKRSRRLFACGVVSTVAVGLLVASPAPANAASAVEYGQIFNGSPAVPDPDHRDLSVLPDGTTPALGASGVPGVSVSGDGTKVAFFSVDHRLDGTYLGPDGVRGVVPSAVQADGTVRSDFFVPYVRDLVSGTTSFEGILPDGSPAPYVSDARLSGDGHWLVFNCWTADGARCGLFLRDLTRGSAADATAALTGVDAAASVSSLSISDDGSGVAFGSGGSTSYVWQRATGSVSAFAGDMPALSGDGHFLATVTDYGHVIEYNLATGGSQEITATPDGTKPFSGGAFGQPALSYDGRYVAFGSDSASLLGTGSGGRRIFRRDTLTQTTVLVDQPDGVADGASGVGTSVVLGGISADGSVVAFVSDCPTLVPGVTFTGYSGQFPLEVYTRQLTTNHTHLVSASADGSTPFSNSAIVPGGDSPFPSPFSAASLNATGTLVAFPGRRLLGEYFEVYAAPVPQAVAPPLSYDGNGDSVPDITQANVASLPVVTSLPAGTPPTFVTLAAPVGATLSNATSVDAASIATVPPLGLGLPDGLLNFTVGGIPLGGSETISIYPMSMAGVNGYAKFDPTTGWAKLPDSQVQLFADHIDVTLVDGGSGDADGVANGIIVDPGAIAIIHDTTPPTVAVTGFPEGAKYVLGTSPHPACSASDALTGLAGPCSVKVTGGLANGVGTFTVTATATDRAGNTGTAVAHYKVIYGWNGYLQPINDTAHQVGTATSVFKAGSTVPAKFTLTNASGVAVQPLTAPLWLTPVKGVATSLPVDESVYADSPDAGTTYRQTGGPWTYNWKTDKSLAGFYWRVGVRLDDGETYYVNLALR